MSDDDAPLMLEVEFPPFVPHGATWILFTFPASPEPPPVVKIEVQNIPRAMLLPLLQEIVNVLAEAKAELT